MSVSLRIVPRNDHLDASLLAQSGAGVVAGFEATNTQNRRRGIVSSDCMNGGGK
jgi:hypothetical protein